MFEVHKLVYNFIDLGIRNNDNNENNFRKSYDSMWSQIN